MCRPWTVDRKPEDRGKALTTGSSSRSENHLFRRETKKTSEERKASAETTQRSMGARGSHNVFWANTNREEEEKREKLILAVIGGKKRFLLPRGITTSKFEKIVGCRSTKQKPKNPRTPKAPRTCKKKGGKVEGGKVVFVCLFEGKKNIYNAGAERHKNVSQNKKVEKERER